MSEKWFERHENIAALASYMAHDLNAKATEVALMVEKPWNFEDTFEDMIAAHADEANGETNRRLRAQS